MKTSTTIKALLAILLISSCTVHQKCQRIINKAYKYHCLKQSNDTFFIKDTVLGFSIDTVFYKIQSIDTFYLKKDSLIIRNIVNWKTGELQTFVKQDTLYITNTVIKTTPAVVKYSKFQKYFNYFLLFLIFSFILRLISK